MKVAKHLMLGSLACAVAGFVLVGCGKKDAYVEPAPVHPPDPAVAQTPPSPAQAPTPRGVPPPPTEADFDIRQVDALVQQRKYESAVDTMLRAQAQAGRQTDAQRLDHHNRMRLLQRQVAQAMASGDPEAQKAARLLQQYNASQTRAGGQ
jgi:hypothetical protein